MKKIKIGIIGCSRIAESSVIPAIKSSETAELYMLGSRETKKAKKFAEKFQCENYGTYEDIICNDNIDAVYISTPVGLHEKWTIESLKSKKHVLCEKSSTTNYESAKRMVRIAKENQMRILEGFMFRFHPSHKKVLEIIHEEKIGKIYSFYGQYGFPDVPHSDIRYNKELGGGVLNDAGCYPICASRMIFRKKPIEVYCNLTMNKDHDIDTNASITIRFDGDIIAKMTVGYNLGYQSKYRIWGEKGLIQLSRAYNIPPDMKPIIQMEFAEKDEKILLEPANHFQLMVDSFCKVILEEENEKFNFEEDLLIQAAIMEACRKSFTEKRVIKISEIK